MNEIEERLDTLNDYLGHMKKALEEILGAEALDRYLYTNMVYIGLQLQDGYHTSESLINDGLDGLQKISTHVGEYVL